MVLAHADSGCTGSVTPHESLLVNRRPCAERFRPATGKVETATCIGDMPVIGKAKDGSYVTETFRNVRCVPSFDYTLLAAKQMWREQRIDSRFADINALVLSDGRQLPFDEKVELPTLRLLSTAGPR